MILFIASEVMFFVAWFWVFFEMALFHRRADRSRRIDEVLRRPGRPGRRKGVETVRPVAPAAGQHPDPADLGHHRDLGAPRAAGTATARAPRSGLVADHPARHAVHLRPGLRVHRIAGRSSLRPDAASTARPSSWRPASTASTCIIGTIFLIVCLIRAHRRRLHAAAALRLRGGRLVLALRRRGLAVPVRLHLRDLRRAAEAEQAAMAAEPVLAGARRPLPQLRRRAAVRRLPARSRPRCEACGFDLAAADFGDGPAVFIILIVGFLVWLSARSSSRSPSIRRSGCTCHLAAADAGLCLAACSGRSRA